MLFLQSESSSFHSDNLSADHFSAAKDAVRLLNKTIKMKAKLIDLLNPFFNRMNVYRNNDTIFYNIPEEIYTSTIQYKIKNMGTYYINRK